MTKSVLKKKKKKKMTYPILEDIPPVNSIKDLIKISKSVNIYRNIDSLMLWRITPYLEELDKLIGMDELKKSIFYQIVYYIQNMHTRNRNEEYLHTIIMGPPGTGKTTVAKIMGNIYISMGILSRSGGFKLGHRDDFVASYLGQTANKTKKFLDSCLGGVLFIDEVYALGPGQKDKDSFSKEAIDTLTSYLSEHKNDFCCIAAGYEDDIKKCFFSVNRGLERRFPWIHKIEKYNSENLADIMLKMISELNWSSSMNKKEIIEIIKNNKELFKNAGGDIETFITKCKMVHARRVFCLSDNHKFILTKKDMENAIIMIKDNLLYNIEEESTSYKMMYM